MSFTDIRIALATHYSNSLLAYPTEWPNDLDFTKPKDETWSRVNFLTTSGPLGTNTFPASIGLGGRDRHDGVMQIDLNYPLKTGDGQSRIDADVLFSEFKAGTRILSNSTYVNCRSVSISPGRRVAGYYKVSVSIAYYAYIDR